MEQQNTPKIEKSKSKSQSPKLRAFKLVQKNLANAGITPNLADQSYPFNGTILLTFLLLGSSIFLTSVFIIYDAETFADYTQSVYMDFLLTATILCLLIFISKVTKLFEFINDINDPVNTTFKYFAGAKSIFNETVQLEQKLSEIILFVVGKLSAACCFAPFLIHTYFIYFTTDSGSDAFQLPSPVWVPFDWKNPLAYLLAITFQYIVALYLMSFGACILALGIGSFFYFIASSEIMKKNLLLIGLCTNDKKTNQHILDQFIEFMQFHSRVKQFLNNFLEIYESIFTILFVWSLATICGALLMIQLLILHHTESLIALSITIVEAIYSFGILFTACELGQRVNIIFNECSEMIEQFEWYLFPAKIQRMLPLIMIFMQQPVEIKCFGSTTCDRETFKYVVNTSFSYFTILRRF